MKKNYIHTTCTFALLGAMAAGLWGCQTDDLAEQVGAPQGELQLTVIDNGYTAGQTLSYEGGTLRELPQTRATETGYTTTFTADDQIGLYAVKNNAVVATNVCLTLNNVSGTLQWQLDSGKKIPTDANYYFAYYPYKLSPSGTMTPSATTADEFFAGMITKWNPAANQSTATNYTAQDLMVGNGALGTTLVGGFYPLNITLTHKMGLAVIKLPDGVTDVTFYNNIPYNGVSGEYRYLTKPSTPTPLSCSFTGGGEVRGFVVAATIAGGNYKTYTVDPPAKIGDYYYDNKTYSTTYDATRTCIGIVFVVNADGKTGKIVGLPEGVNLMWSSKIATTRATDVYNGRTNMATIAAYIKTSWNDYPAFKWVAQQNDKADGGWDATNDKWYLPAKEELKALYGKYSGDTNVDDKVKVAVNASLNAIGAAPLKDTYYWASTEYYNGDSRSVDFSDGTSKYRNKAGGWRVRCVMEF